MNFPWRVIYIYIYELIYEFEEGVNGFHGQ